MLNGTSDLGFVAGFSGETTVTRDFSANTAELRDGIDELKNGGGTSLFDGVSFSCRKLWEYPARRVASVLVVFSDGEDNSSHRNLKQVIQRAESTGDHDLQRRHIKKCKRANRCRPRVASVGRAQRWRSNLPGDMMTFEKSLEKLRELIRCRYLLAYKPADFVPDGKYRAVHVVAERGGKRMQVHVRKGYYARVAAHQ